VIRIIAVAYYVGPMLRKLEYQPCIPTRGIEVPSGPDWFHEIKHDGYRLIVHREGKRVRLLTRRGYDWSDRYPLITRAALRLRKTSFVIDGEAVVVGANGISDFDALHGRKRNAEVVLYAFDLLADDGVDMRDETLRIRKLWLGKLLKRSGGGILYNEHEAGAIGPRLFQQACKMGLEGIVSKHRERGYRAGRSPHWIKVKNPKSPAMVRAKGGTW
jgi:bifunctional non-homologous end joining protein LigD